jgi:hypothetical protein
MTIDQKPVLKQTLQQSFDTKVLLAGGISLFTTGLSTRRILFFTIDPRLK